MVVGPVSWAIPADVAHPLRMSLSGGCIPFTWSCYMCDNGVPCDDGNSLTYDDKCLNMKCLGTGGLRGLHRCLRIRSGFVKHLQTLSLRTRLLVAFQQQRPRGQGLVGMP